MPQDLSAREKGAWGEQTAREFLETQGYSFVASNWACKMGEIDLIMQEGATRVLVEVRLRSRLSQYGAGFDTVAYQKQRKLLNTAKFYQQRQNYWGDIRFDVVSIIDVPGNPIIDHITDAF